MWHSHGILGLHIINGIHLFMQLIDGIRESLVEGVVFRAGDVAVSADAHADLSFFDEERVAICFLALFVKEEVAGNDGGVARLVYGKFAAFFQDDGVGGDERVVVHPCEQQGVPGLGGFHHAFYMACVVCARGHHEPDESCGKNIPYIHLKSDIVN